MILHRKTVFESNWFWLVVFAVLVLGLAWAVWA